MINYIKEAITPSVVDIPQFNSKTEAIQQIAKKILIEAAFSAAMVGAACFFVANPISLVILIGSAAAALLFNGAVRTLLAYFAYKYQNEDNPEIKERLSYGIKLCQWLCPTSFAIIQSTTLDTLVHETGHVAAAYLFYKNPLPRITINPFEGGDTSYLIRGLTELGKKIKFYNTQTITSAAGTVFAVGLSLIGIIVSHAMRDSHPEFSRYLLASSITNIALHAFYALSALWTAASELGHDFVRLSLAGFHPLLGTALLIATPLILKIALVAGSALL